MTNQSLRRALHKPKASSHLVKWLVKLNDFDISYKPRETIKVHALADFIAECTKLGKEAGYNQRAGEENTTRVWMVMVDGSRRKQGSGTWVILVSPEGLSSPMH